MKEAALYEALLSIKNKQEMACFLKDLCTPNEIKSLTERWNTCTLLAEGDKSYRQIQEITGASLATITRVARFLRHESHNGYRLVLARLKNKKGQKS